MTIKELIEQFVEQEIQQQVSYRDKKFTDPNSGEVYLVGDIVDFVKNNGVADIIFNVEELANNNLHTNEEDIANNPTDDIPGSKDFIAQADNTDVEFPIYVIEYPDGLYVANGIHRLWKAKEMGLKNLRGYLIKSDNLPQIPKMQKDFSSIGGGGVSATGGQPLGIDMSSQHKTMWSGSVPVKRTKKRKLGEDHQVLMDLIENVLDDMGLEKATNSVRRGMIGGGAVYMDRHDPNKKRTKDVMAKVAKNLNKKPYSHDPPRMGLGEGRPEDSGKIV